MLNAGGGKRFQHIINIRFLQASQEAWYSVPSSRGFARKVVYGRHLESRGAGGGGGGRGQTASTSFNIRENKRNVEQMLKQSLKAFKLIQYRFNKFQHGFKGVANGFAIFSGLRSAHPCLLFLQNLNRSKTMLHKKVDRAGKFQKRFAIFPLLLRYVSHVVSLQWFVDSFLCNLFLI